MSDDKPDASAARDAAAEILGYHGCVSGDCPHEKQSECFAALVEAGYDAGHARALKEMGAELADAEMRAKSAFAANTISREQLAAAQRERDQQQEWAMKFQRERDAAESERDSYALEVEALTKAILSVEVLGPRAKFYVDKADAITAHRRGGES